MAKATGTEKTTPDARENADKDTFAKEFLVRVDSDPASVGKGKKVDAQTIEDNKTSVVQEAIQRGLRPDGDVTLVSEEPQDENNVLLSYTVDVKSATDTQ